MTKYVVLRRPLATGGLRGFEGTAGFGGAMDAVPLPSIQIEDVPSQSRADFLADPEISVASPVMPTKLVEPVSTGAAGLAWGIGAVGADKSRFAGNGIRVAVLDTGIQHDHPAFAGVNLLQQDFSGDGNGDRAGHGTHCAGTIFGRDVGGLRIGLARGVKDALIGKVLKDDGRGESDMVFRALYWAMEQRADVISMSLGFDFPGMVANFVKDGWPADLATSVALESYRGNLRMFDAVMEMLRAQVAFGVSPLVIAAAGNESRRQMNPDYRIAASLPAAANDVVSVAAVGRSGENYDVADFSNSMALLAAPGVDITSAALGGGLTSMSGTSMACPHVAGVAALWFEQIRASGKKATAKSVTANLIATARDPGFADRVSEIDIGRGMVICPE